AVTVAVHHLLLWMFLPASVFNYDAPWWVVAVHAAFVVLESVATIYIARSFFDSVIGLEKVVQERTTALEDRNRAMRLVLDNVEEGLLTIDGTGASSASTQQRLVSGSASPQRANLLRTSSPVVMSTLPLSSPPAGSNTSTTFCPPN